MTTLQDCFYTLSDNFNVTITIYKDIIDDKIVYMNEKEYISYMRKNKIEGLNKLRKLKIEEILKD